VIFLLTTSTDNTPVWAFEVFLPGWNALCFEIDRAASGVRCSVNGQTGSQEVVDFLSLAVTYLLADTTIYMSWSELFTEFNFYSRPLSKIVPGSGGDLLAWNIQHWKLRPHARKITVDKTDIYLPGRPRYLAVPVNLNFQDAVSTKYTI